MKACLLLVVVLLLSACDREAPASVSTQPLPHATPRPSAELVDALARDLSRLKELRRQCREDRAHVSDELCIASALAVRKRFLGGGGKHNTPQG